MIVFNFAILNKWKRIVHEYGSIDVFLANLIIYVRIIYTHIFIFQKTLVIDKDSERETEEETENKHREGKKMH